MRLEPNRWQRLKTAYRQTAALPRDEREAILALLAERDRELTAELEALLEHADDRIDEILAASAVDFAADAARVDRDVRRLVRIVEVLCAVRRARSRAASAADGAEAKARLAR